MRHCFFIFLVLATSLGGCAKDLDVLPEQISKIESYLKSTHVPKLISDADRALSTDRNPEFYTVAGDAAYRYIRHYYDSERAAYPQVEPGDFVSITFRMYVFDYKNIAYYPSGADNTITGPFYSNDPVIEQALKDAGLFSDEWSWSFDPYEIKLGDTDIIDGIEVSLAGCRERDTVEVFMTYSMAYGSQLFSVIPKQSPVAVIFSVDKVTKN